MKRRLVKSNITILSTIAVAGILVVGVKVATMQSDTQQAVNRSVSQTTAPNSLRDISPSPKQILTKTEIMTLEENVPYDTLETYDGTLSKDITVVRVEGQEGKKLIKYEIKIKDGIEIERSLISEKIIVPPVTEVIAIGTKVATQKKENRNICNPNYRPCIPNVRKDLDCEDIRVVIEIVGVDVYKLEDDVQDGIACEAYSQDFINIER